MRQTLFTPTYNRADTLPRLYESIKLQTFKDFKWLIIDDGSMDATDLLIRSWLNTDCIRTTNDGFVGISSDSDWLQIQYVKKENGGKHTAQRMAYEIASTDYITEVDSDDALLPTAIEDFEIAWVDIENCNKCIAKVSMFTTSPDGQIRGYGNYRIPEGVSYIEATWQDYVLKQHNNRELLSSISVEKFKECVDYSLFDISNGKPMKFLGEGILWSLIGKKYPTRILNKVGLTVHLDASNSILRGEQNFFNNMANSIYFEDLNISYFWWNPKYFIGNEKRMCDSAVKAGVSLSKMIGYMKSTKRKILMSIFYIPFYFIAKIKR